MSPAAALTDPRFRRALTQMVRRRVPEHDAEDIVQSALAEALAASTAPPDADGLRRFVWGIARHKVADFYRRARREELDVPELEGAGAPHGEADLLRWAARELPPGKDAEQTLEWMLREGEGEKLEAIAESENLPAPRVRQRVSRLRRHLRERWALEVAALAAIGAVVALIVWEMTRRPGVPITHDEPIPAPSQEPPRVRDAPPNALPGGNDAPNTAPLAPSSVPLAPSSVPLAPSSVPLAPSASSAQKTAPRSSLAPQIPTASQRQSTNRKPPSSSAPPAAKQDPSTTKTGLASDFDDSMFAPAASSNSSSASSTSKSSKPSKK